MQMPRSPAGAARRTTLLPRAAWRLEMRSGALLDMKTGRASDATPPLDRSVVR